MNIFAIFWFTMFIVSVSINIYCFHQIKDLEDDIDHIDHISYRTIEDLHKKIDSLTNEQDLIK